MAAKKASTKKTVAKKTTSVKASAETTVKTTSVAFEARAKRASALLRKGALAYVGLYGAAYDRAKLSAEQVREAANKARTQGEEFFGTLVVKGEEIEVQATKLAKDAQKTATETFEETTEKVKSFVPSNILPLSANDRASELQAEVEALNKKIAALSKKKSAPRKAVKMTTEKVAINKEVVAETTKVA